MFVIRRYLPRTEISGFRFVTWRLRQRWKKSIVGPRCASLPRRARIRFEGQSNGVKSPRVATRNVTKPWKRAGRASASHFLSGSRPLTSSSSVFLCPLTLLSSSLFSSISGRPKPRVFPLLGPQRRKPRVGVLLSSMRNTLVLACIRYSTFLTSRASLFPIWEFSVSLIYELPSRSIDRVHFCYLGLDNKTLGGERNVGKYLRQQIALCLCM